MRRWRAAGPAQRRVLEPVLWAGGAVAVLGTIDIIASSGGADGVSNALDWPLLFAICAVPLGFLAGLMRASLSRAGAVSELVERLGRERGGVRDALASALGDPTLELAYWLPEHQRYVDAAGDEMRLPEPGGPRAVTEIEQEGRRIAALVHDAALLDQPELVRAAGAAAALALENERLDAELRARYEDLRASRARLVEASDAARRRIERDLHDGAQQRFVALALTLRLARNRLDPDSEAAGAGGPRPGGARRRPVRAARARARDPPGRPERARAGAGARVARRPRARAGRALRAARAAAAAAGRDRRVLPRRRGADQRRPLRAGERGRRRGDARV